MLIAAPPPILHDLFVVGVYRALERVVKYLRPFAQIPSLPASMPDDDDCHILRREGGAAILSVLVGQSRDEFAIGFRFACFVGDVSVAPEIAIRGRRLRQYQYNGPLSPRLRRRRCGRLA